MNRRKNLSAGGALQSLTKRLGEDMVLAGEAETILYRRDWHGDVAGEALAVLKPRSTQEVSRAVVACRDLELQIVPQGGNTGLVLGALPESATRHVVLSLERMNRIRSIDPDDFSAVVEAGCILATVKEEAATHGMFFPLALGAQGSCQIGGNVSTNAGGINVLRYGMMRELVLGVEVVLPDGEVFHGLSTLRKDNRGIDLKQLFIGAEGTLGIITAVALKLSPLQTQRETALLAVSCLDDAVALFRLARHECCDLMSAFEFMPPTAFALAKEALPDLVMPLAGDYAAYVVMEISGSGLVNIAELMQRFLELGMGRELIVDGVIASSEAQARNLWLFREAMVEGQAKRGVHLRTDVSVPLSRLSAFVHDAENALHQALPEAFCLSYGHIGDGNVHLNVHPPADWCAGEKSGFIQQAKHIINATLKAYGGSISAEHGIGRLKRKEFEADMAPAQRHLLRSIRRAIDPEMTMNPGCLPD